MISKIGQLLLEMRPMEKQGSATAAAIAAAKFLGMGAGVHLLQNAAMQQMIRYMQKSGLLDVAVRASGKPGQGMGTYGKDIVYGVADGLMPEIGILSKEIEHKIGLPLQNTLKKQNIDINNLPRRHETVLGLMGAGRFRDAYRVANTPETREAANSVLGNIYPGSEVIVDQLPVSKGKIFDTFLERLKQNNIEVSLDQNRVDKFLEHLEQKYLEDPLTANIAKAFREDKGTKIKQILKGNDSPGKKLARTAARDLTRTGLGITEPATALVNEGKRLMNWEAAGEAVPALGKLQNWFGDKIVKEPIEQHLVKGLRGEVVPKFSSPAQLRRDVRNVRRTEGEEAAKELKKALLLDAANAYGLNFLSNRVNHAFNTFGLAAAKAGISPEHYRQLKETAPKIQETWRNLVEEMRAAKKPVIDTTATPVKPAITAPPVPTMPSKPAITIPKKKPGFSYVDFSQEMDSAAGLGGLLNKKAALR